MPNTQAGTPISASQLDHRARPSPPGVQRYRFHQPVRSERNHSEPSGVQRGSDDRLARPAGDDGLLAGRQVAHQQLGVVPRHRRVVPPHPGQRRPVRGQPGRGHEVRTADQHLGLRRRVRGQPHDLVAHLGGRRAACCSAHADDRPPSGRGRRRPSGRRAARRARRSAVPASPPGSSRYSRWSAQLTNQITPSRTHHAPPPYSWTAVRALKPSGSRSVPVPSASRRTSWVRPPSAGPPSAHTRSAPSTSDSPSRRQRRRPARR